MSRTRKLLITIVILEFLLLAIGCVKFNTSPIQWIGGAFCHQFAERSPETDGHYAPFCYRCLGMFLGIGFSLLFFRIFKQIPAVFARYAIGFILVSGLFFALDIANSTTLADINIYPDQFRTRFLSGFGMGFALPLIITPLHTAVFPHKLYEVHPWNSWKNLAFCFSSGLLCYGAVFYRAGIFLPIVSIMSICSAVFFLIYLYNMVIKVVVLCLNKDMNTITVKMLGTTLALLQVILLGWLHLLIIQML